MKQIFFSSLICISFNFCIGSGTVSEAGFIVGPDLPPTHFYYFAYGSNLLKKRVQINNRSAKFYSIALLKEVGLIDKENSLLTQKEEIRARAIPTAYRMLIKEPIRKKMQEAGSVNDIECRRLAQSMISNNFFVGDLAGAIEHLSKKKIWPKTILKISTPHTKGYRLDFNVTEEMWNGAVATIARDPDSEVWGNVWIIHRKDRENLDRQESLGSMYSAENVTVVTPLREIITARTYIQYVDPPKVSPQNLPAVRQPSLTYLKVIILGASESGLPAYYINKIRRFAHNGREAHQIIRDQLGYPFMEVRRRVDIRGL